MDRLVTALLVPNYADVQTLGFPLVWVVISSSLDTVASKSVSDLRRDSAAFLPPLHCLSSEYCQSRFSNLCAINGINALLLAIVSPLIDRH